MITAMIDGQPNTNDPTIVDAPNAPIASPSACSA